VLNMENEFHARVNQQLKEADVIWLTTVSPSGAPQPNPVWFLWDGDDIIIYSKPDSYRIRNLKHNKIVSLHLEGADVMGNNVVVIHGKASMDPDYKDPHPDYVVKYEKYLPELNITMDQLIAAYSVEIRVKPSRVRGS
jgi:PPOX class probable F420-dependent enzyme